MSTGTVTLERRGAVALVTLAHPSRRNALDSSMWTALGEVAEQLQAAPPRAVVITGAGEAFSAGMDVNPSNPHVASIVGAVQEGDAGPVRAMLLEQHAVLDRLFALPVPLIAAVSGLAYGGGAELATRCDLRVADPHAVFCFSEVRLGLMPDWGGGVALTRLLGPGRAADLILTARQVAADEAFALGLVNRIAAPGAVVAEAIALAEQIAANGPRAVRAALSVIRTTMDVPFRAAVSAELDAATALIATGECQVGISAFLARTEPAFTD